MKFIVRFFVPLLCSFYLAIIIGQHLNATLSRYLLLGVIFFWLFNNLLGTVYNKLLKGGKFDAKGMLLCGVISLSLLVAWSSTLIPILTPISKWADITITALGTKNDKSASTEVWITALNNGGVPYDFSRVIVDSAWEIKNNKIASFRRQPAVLNLHISDAATPYVLFTMHPWSGKVKITDGSEETIVDLYTPGENGEYRYDVKNIFVKHGTSHVLPVISAVLSFTFFFILTYIIFLLVSFRIKK